MRSDRDAPSPAETAGLGRRPDARRPIGMALGGLLGLLVGGVALWVSLQGVDPAALVEAFARAGLGTLAAGTALHVVVQAIYAARWRLLLGRPPTLPWTRLFGFVALGYLANYTLPGRPGELVRAGLAGGLGRVALVAALASVLVEKLLDGATILVSAGLYLSLSPAPDWLATAVGLGGFLFVAGCLALAALALTSVARLPIPDALRTQIRHVGAPIRSLVVQGTWPGAIGLGLLAWAAIVAQQAVLSVGAGASSAPAAWLLLYASLGLASVLPGAPGYVGTYQIAAVLALGAFGADREAAIVVATLYQLSRLLGALLVGGWAVAREGTSILGSALLAGRGRQPESGEPVPRVS